MLQCQLIYVTVIMLKQTRLSSVASTDCVFCNVIGSWKFLARKQKALMKPKESAECHQTISSRVGSGHKTELGVAFVALTHIQSVARQHCTWLQV